MKKVLFAVAGAVALSAIAFGAYAVNAGPSAPNKGVRPATCPAPTAATAAQGGAPGAPEDGGVCGCCGTGASTAATLPLAVATIEGNVQTVETKLQADGYPPIKVQKGIPVKWNLKADESSLTSCNNKIIIESLGITKQLKVGDNIIEFTPETSGSIQVTCWMDMLQSEIVVVDQL